MSRAKPAAADAKEPTTTADANAPVVTNTEITNAAPTVTTDVTDATGSEAPQPPAEAIVPEVLQQALPAWPRAVTLINETARDYAPGGKFVEKYQSVVVLVKDADEATRLATDCRALIALDENYRDLEPLPLRIEA
jgi:hypothetical protein